MEPWEIEQLRRSVVMLPPGHSVGAMSRDQALALFEELAAEKRQSERYRELVDEIRRLIGNR